MDVVLKEGWLHKKGGGNKRSNWTKRWFVLYNDRVEYYAEKGKKPPPKGTIPIDGNILSFNVRPYSGKAHSFEIILPERTYTIQSGSDLEMHSWIRDVLEAYKARRKELEENTEKSREAQFRTRESKLLVGDTESQKMIEAQLRFDDLYKYDEARIRKEGYMKKSSGGKKDVTKKAGKSNSALKVEKTKNWRNRYFVLTLSQIIYYENADKQVIKGVIDLNLLQDVVSLQKETMFLICLPQRTFHLRATNDREKQEWIDAIRECNETKIEMLKKERQTGKASCVDKQRMSTKITEEEVRGWSCANVVDWLSRFAVSGQVREAFLENQICGIDLLELQEAELEEDLGITDIDSRALIADEIRFIRNPLARSIPRGVPSKRSSVIVKSASSASVLGSSGGSRVLADSGARLNQSSNDAASRAPPPPPPGGLSVSPSPIPSSSTSTATSPAPHVVVASTAGVESWNSARVIEWAKQNNLNADIIRSLDENQIAGVDLLELTGDEMESDLGLTALESRLRLLSAIADLKKGPSVVRSSTTSAMPTRLSGISRAPAPVPFGRTGSKPAKTWEVADVLEWLRGLSIAEEIVTQFEENAIRGVDLLELQEGELQDDLEIADTEAVALISLHIRRLKSTGVSTNSKYASSATVTGAKDLSATARSPLRAPANLKPPSDTPPPPLSDAPPPIPGTPLLAPSTPQHPRTAAPPPPSSPLPARLNISSHSSPVRSSSPCSPIGSPQHSHLLITSHSSSSSSPSSPSSPTQSPPKVPASEAISIVMKWCVEDVLEWLVSIGVKSVCDQFKQNKITGKDLLEIGEEDLSDSLEIDDFRVISAITRGIAMLRKGILRPQRLFAEKSEQQAECEETSDLADGWKEYVDSKGRKYYYNKRTRQKQWNKPAGISLNSEAETVSKNPKAYYWTAQQVREWILTIGELSSEVAAAFFSAGIVGTQLLSYSLEKFESKGVNIDSNSFSTLTKHITVLLKDQSVKYVALWSFDADKPSKLTVQAGATVYLVEEVDDDWVRARDLKGGYGLVPLRYLQVVDKTKDGSKLARPLSRKRSMRSTVVMKEKVRPADWTTEDVVQWLNDIECTEVVPNFEENKIVGKDLLELSSEEMKEDLGLDDGMALSMIETGVKMLRNERVPRSARQVKSPQLWNNADVCSWLGEVGCGNASQKFQEHNVQGCELKTLDISKLKNMIGDEALASMVHRRIMSLQRASPMNTRPSANV